MQVMLYKIAMVVVVVVVEWMARLKMKFFHLGSFHLGPPILQAKVAALLLRADVSFPICISTSNTSPPSLSLSQPVSLIKIEKTSLLLFYFLGTNRSLFLPSSVTTFGEISPLWQHILQLWQNWDGLVSIWQNFEPTLAKVVCYWAKFHCCKWPKIIQLSSHLVTLLPRPWGAFPEANATRCFNLSPSHLILCSQSMEGDLDLA